MYVGASRSECSSAQQARVHPGRCDGGRVSRRQLQLLVPTSDLDSTPQVRQRAVRRHAVQPGMTGGVSHALSAHDRM